MSQENVEIAKRGIDAFNRRDVDGWADLMTSDFEFVPALLRVVEGGSYRDARASKGTSPRISDAWEEIRIVAEEISRPWRPRTRARSNRGSR